MTTSSVKVAVRARPLNKREIEMGSQVILSFEGKNVTIINKKLSNELSLDKHKIKNPFYMKQFSFDFSYWSVSEKDPHYAKEEQIYADLGADVVRSALVGYNACIFAYGQTGAGKTHSMIGTNKKPGLIPRICRNLFAKFDGNKETSCRAEISYIEIYNEQVRDLLRRTQPTLKKQDSLKVREHPKDGPFVQGVNIHPVTDYSQLEHLMDLGNALRVTGSTMMNDSSSRSHAIFTIKFSQAKFSENVPSETVSKINLVDLAGSERASSSGATGLRLKEGGRINKSLTTLGSVISALAANSTAATNQRGSNKKLSFVPYRDSVLTWLLKDSIGGNSKTIMIAAVSPAEVNYGETLSTLRYASRAMKIVNKPVINEDPNVKLIRELRAEIERLRTMIEGDSKTNSLNRSVSLAIEAKLAEEQDKAEQLLQNWRHKWEQTQAIFQEEQMTMRKQGRQTLLISEKPHFVGIDVDPLSVEIVIYRLEEGITTIGSGDLTEEQGIALNGSGIEREHCRVEVTNDGEFVFIKPLSSKCYVNNYHVEDERRLKQGDTVQFGDCLKFKFNNPKEAAILLERRRSTNFFVEAGFEFYRDRSLDSGLSCPEDLDACENLDVAIQRQYNGKQFSLASCPNLAGPAPIFSDSLSREASPANSPILRQDTPSSVIFRKKRPNHAAAEKRLSTPINFPTRPLELDSSPIERPGRQWRSTIDVQVDSSLTRDARTYSFNKIDFDEKKEYVRDLMKKYRKKEVNRIEDDRRFKNNCDKQLEKLQKKRKKVVEIKEANAEKLKETQNILEQFREKSKTEKDRKRRIVEKQIDQIVDSVKIKTSNSAEAEKELRKKKFQLRSKVEDFYKRMDLYENCLLGIELDRRGHDNAKRDDKAGNFPEDKILIEAIPVQSKDINTLLEQKQILEELMRRHHEALHNNDDKVERIQTNFDKCKAEYASRIAESNALLKELKDHRELTSEMIEKENHAEETLGNNETQVVHTLRYIDSVSSPLHIEQQELNDRGTIFEFPEETFIDDNNKNPVSGVTDHALLNKSKAIPHARLKKTVSKSEKLETMKNKYEELIEEAERSIVELKSARTLELDQYHNEADGANTFCLKIKQRIADDKSRLDSVQHELEKRRMTVSELENPSWAGSSSDVSSVEQQKLLLLRSREKVVELFESSLQNALKDACAEVKTLQRKSWAGFTLSRSKDYASTKELLSTIMESVEIENLDQIAEKEAEMANYRRLLSSTDLQLKDLDEKEVSLQADVFQQMESRKLRSEMSRVEHYENISQSVEQLLMIAEGEDSSRSDTVSKHITKETEFLGKCRKRLEELEKCMFTKVRENKDLNAKMRHAQDRLRSSTSSELDDYDDATDCRIEIEIEELESKKVACEREIDVLNKRLEEERIQYLDVLKAQDDFVIIGKEYREARNITLKVLGNQALADVQKEVFWASNAIDLMEQGIDPVDSPMAGGWRHFATEKDVQIMKKTVSKNGYQSFLGRGVIKAPPHLVWESVRNPLSRFIYDNLLKKINVIEHIDDNLKVVYMRHEGRVCVLKHCRDFCTIHCERTQGDMFIAASQSAEHPDCPKVPNVIRGKLLPSGWVVEPYLENDQDWSIVWYIVKVDLEGSVPSALMNFLCKRLPLSIAYLRSYLVYN